MAWALSIIVACRPLPGVSALRLQVRGSQMASYGEAFEGFIYQPL